MLCERKTSGAVYMKSRRSRAKTTMIGRPSTRPSDVAMRPNGPISRSYRFCCSPMRNSVSSATVICFGSDLGDDLAAVEHDQAIGDLVDMGEVVLDIDAGASGSLDPAHEVENLAHLLHCKRDSRLVEDDQVGVEVHGTPDRDALALAARKLLHGRIDRKSRAAEADGLEQDILRYRFFALHIDKAEAVGDLPADEEIAPQGLFVAERLVLIDGLDGKLVRHAHRIVRQVDRPVAHEDAAAARAQHPGHDLDKGRLAGAVVADEPDDLVAAHGKVDVAQCLDGAEILLDALQAHDVAEGLRSRRRSGLSHRHLAARGLWREHRICSSLPPRLARGLAAAAPLGGCANQSEASENPARLSTDEWRGETFRQARRGEGKAVARRSKAPPACAVRG